ncbi:MATE family efflux transporter [Sphingopyxis sp. BSNA05]|uniref:MATE family efflux transporter n=1 Tax=Sphingopyxis sp. BSNA05 TaxID=1236614 RepID=UPI0020B8219C|nr:MATE family efflux transporter [Sphingopyxis sp. BSNA05]
MLVVSGSAVVMIGFVNGYGINTAAAYGVTAQLWSYIQMPAMALGAAASAMAAQNIGAGKWDRVSAITRSGIMANIALTGFWWW